MLVNTLARVSGNGTGISVADPIIICGAEHRDLVLDQCKQADISLNALIIEPVGRNTAPAAALAAMVVREIDPDGLILLLPADHHVSDPEGFWRWVETAQPIAADGFITTFGIKPTHPETGYGYIKTGETIGDMAYRIDRFAEKPDLATAQAYLDDGSYYWNAGIFLFSATAILEEFDTIAADISNSCHSALKGGGRDGKVYTLCPDTFANCRSESVDYAIMEETRRGAIVGPVEIGWNDIGAWSAVREILAEAGSDATVTVGNVIEIDTRSSYVRSDGPLVSVIGLENVVVVATDDAVLVARADRAQDVKRVVEALKAGKKTDLL
nr:hypothetical protein GCM10011355_32800 [Aquisalinus luteolus]